MRFYKGDIVRWARELNQRDAVISGTVDRITIDEDGREMVYAYFHGPSGGTSWLYADLLDLIGNPHDLEPIS